MVDPKEEKCANFDVSSLTPYKMEWTKYVMSKKWPEIAINSKWIIKEWDMQKMGWAKNVTCRKRNVKKLKWAVYGMNSKWN